MYTINRLLNTKQIHIQYKTSIQITMKACDVEHMINVIVRQKIQTTNTIRTLKCKLRSAKAMQQNLARTLTQQPHFLNYAISAQILQTEDTFNTKVTNMITTLEEEMAESITTLNKVPGSIPAK